ncbi:hypothetical protein MY11210_008917 [Beauveria gryllotalpidicola]
MKPSIRLNSTVLVISCLVTGLFLWLFLGLGHDFLPYARIPSANTVDDHEPVPEQEELLVDTTPEYIPNTAHYVYILANVSGDLSFAFSEVLSIYATSRYWRPDAIYLHTNAPAEALERARSGAAGKWTRLLFQVPNLRIAAATVPTHARNGKEIRLMEHKSDFVRVQAIREHGGVYLDFDVHPLRSVRALRESGFHAVAGRQRGAEVNSGVFMSRPRSRMMELWSEGMGEAFNGEWTAHSNHVLTVVCERLVAESPEVLIMERNAFAPGGWTGDDIVRLLEVHHDETSSLDLLSPDGRLPGYDDEEPMTRWSAAPKRQPEWAQDWSRTYMLHAFNHFQGDFQIPGFDRITPRYILERRSNMARAVYPVAKELFEQGLIDVDDPYKFYTD